MNDTDTHPDVLRYVQARRVSTDDAAGGSVDENVGVVLESPVTIDVENVGSFTLLCTPDDKRALAVGFMRSEGIIEGLDDIADLRECRTDSSIMRVKLTGRAPLVEDPDRSLLITSSCGACGSEDLEARIKALPRVGDSLRIESRLLRAVRDALRRSQALFAACGGTHAAGIFTDSAKIISCAEDAGRHNALDKAIGKCLLTGQPSAGRGAALSGRVSLEMVSKCARAGIELITAISAPTSLAIEVADRCNITLCAFVRETRATVFTHPGRVASR